jgi:hypothetical protein
MVACVRRCNLANTGVASVLSGLCSRGTRPLRFQVLNTVFEGRGNSFTTDEAQAIFKHVLENSIQTCSISITEFGPRNYSEPSEFVSLIDHSLRLGLADALSSILEESNHRFQTAKLPDEARSNGADPDEPRPKIAKFLGDLLTFLQKQDFSETPLKSEFKSLFETILTRFFLRTAPCFPEEKFKVSRCILISEQVTDRGSNPGQVWTRIRA